jgi:transposase
VKYRTLSTKIWLILSNQSHIRNHVTLVHFVLKTYSYDAGKKVKGKKRHLLVDTQGLGLAIRVSPASETDRQGAIEVFKIADKLQINQVKQVYTDGAYRGKHISQVNKEFGINLSIVKKTAKQGFKVLPKRWVVERTFAWLDKCRRLSKNYERLTTTSEVLSYLQGAD